MTRWLRWLSLLLLAGWASACANAPSRYYYNLTYPPPEPAFDTPHPFSIRVKAFDVRDTYGGAELVFRPDVHEIRYFKSRRWSERPKKMITALVRDHLQRAGVVRQVTDSLGQSSPDFTFTGEVEAIEELEVGSDRYAHIAISYRLTRFEDDSVLWRYRFDERRPVGGRSIRGSVRTLSELLREATTRAVAGLGRYLVAPDAVAAPEVRDEVDVGPPHPEDDEIIRPEDESELNDHPQLRRDETPVPVGFGAIFVPALSSGDREPLVIVYRDGEFEAEGRTGNRIVVSPGEYEVRVGSGALDQRVLQRVRVEDGRTTPVPPTWSSLEVNVVDEQFVPFRGVYELIRMDTREDYGIGLGADEQVGEKTRVWVLPPALYKLVRSGGTYRDRTSFATVRVLEGELTRFTLVMDPDTGDFVGAGEDAPTGAPVDEDDPWQLRAVLGGQVRFERGAAEGQEEEDWTLGASVFFDGALRLDQGSHLWVTRLDLEEGQERPAGLQFFENEEDRVYLHSIYTYRLVPWFGPYARGGVETRLLPTHAVFPDERTVVEFDQENRPSKTHEDVLRVPLGGPFRDTELRQGLGGNFQALRSGFLELDIRAGLGSRQYFANGLLNYEEATNVLTPALDDRAEGPEGTLVGLARLSRWMTMTFELDGLFPFDDMVDGAIVNWRSQASLRLVSFISLVYRLQYRQDRTRDLRDPSKTTHDVQLRFSYTLF